METYSPEFKRSLVHKVLSNRTKSIDDVAKESEVSRASLFRWVKDFGPIAVDLKKRCIRPQDWSLGAKLRSLLETQNMKDNELGEYLRRHGLYFAHLVEWKAEILDEVKKNGKSNKMPSSDSTYLRKIRELERELKIKDMALREATALLALKKKVESIWGEKEGDESPSRKGSSAQTSSKKPKKTAAD